MSKNIINLTGKIFGRLTVIGQSPSRDKKGRIVWHCKCACGNERDVFGGYLRGGATKSCGCLQPETARARETKHGGRGTRLYKIWAGIKQRCLNPKNPNASRYSLRGISVCPEWLSFAPFQKWAMENGYGDGLTIDRIDNDKGYSPENCRWATRTEQVRNRSDNIRLTYKGETLQIAVAAQRAGLPLSAVRARKARGWSDERTLTRPLDQKKRGKQYGATLGRQNPRD